MYAIFLVVLTLMVLASLGRMLEASRRHAVCVRFEHDLTRSLDDDPDGWRRGAGR